MAEVTYYWDTRGAAGWDNDPDYMIDGILTNYAYTSLDGRKQWLTSTSCDGVDLGTITKVEVRVYGYGDGNDRIDLAFDVDFDPEYQISMPDEANKGWSSYVDVTNDPWVNGWTWAKVADLWTELTKRLWVEFDKVGKGNTMYCAKVEIRVTYTPIGPPEKVTQYLPGNDLPEFPHEMDLESDKLPCPLPY